MHEKAGPLAIGFVVCATLFSLVTQAYVIGGTPSSIAAQLGVGPGTRLRGSAGVERGVLALALLMPVLVEVSMVGFGVWLWDALPPAALSCPH